MEVSINLLPQHKRHKEKRTIYLIPVIGIMAVVVIASILTYSYIATKSSITLLSKSITEQTAVRNQMMKQFQQKNTGITEYNFAEKYKKLHEFLHSIYKSTSGLYEEIVHLLPNNAEVTSYAYINNGDLTITINFASVDDAALFLHQLLNADFIENAEMESISTNTGNPTYKSIFHLKLNTLAGEK